MVLAITTAETVIIAIALSIHLSFHLLVLLIYPDCYSVRKLVFFALFEDFQSISELHS